MPESNKPKIALVANAAWNLWNFRRSLIELLANEGFEIICLAPKDGFEKNLDSMGAVKFLSLKHLSRKSLSPLNNLRTLAEIARHLRREKPDLAVFYTIKPNVFGALAARLAGVPTSIATVEGLGYAATSSFLLRHFIYGLYRFALHFVKKVVFLNQDDRAEFIRHRVVGSHKTLVVKGTGVDTQYFSPSMAFAPTSPIFLFVGRLLSDKGIREFVQAAAQVKTRAPQARFQILGSLDAGNPASIEPAELRQWIEGQHIEYLGQTDDVRPFVACASIIVLPSYREGMPRVLLEGMAMGKPIITTDSVGCRETVDEGKNGFIVPAENASALADAMLRFLALPPAQQLAMGHHSREKAASEFGNDIVLPQYLQLVQYLFRLPSKSM